MQNKAYLTKKAGQTRSFLLQFQSVTVCHSFISLSSPAQWAVGIISQWPPLSGPTRRMIPASRNLRIARVTFLRSMPILSAISCVDIFAFPTTSSMIFWGVFWGVFWDVFWVVFCEPFLTLVGVLVGVADENHENSLI